MVAAEVLHLHLYLGLRTAGSDRFRFRTLGTGPHLLGRSIADGLVRAFRMAPIAGEPVKDLTVIGVEHLYRTCTSSVVQDNGGAAIRRDPAGACVGASSGIRTQDLCITNALLCR